MMVGSRLLFFKARLRVGWAVGGYVPGRVETFSGDGGRWVEVGGLGFWWGFRLGVVL